MPILGAWAVLDRIEKVMKQGFAGTLQRLEFDLRAEGALGGSPGHPDADVPSDAEYLRDEDPASDTVTTVITRCNSSEILNEPSNHQDVIWQHEIVVEVIQQIETVTTDRLLSAIHRYGTAMAMLFGAQRPQLEWSEDSVNDTFLEGTATDDPLSDWTLPDNVLVADSARATLSDRSVADTQLFVHYTLSDFIPDVNAIVLGLNIQVQGYCDDPVAANRTIKVTPYKTDQSAPLPGAIGQNHILAEGTSDTLTWTGGATNLYAMTALDPNVVWGTENLKFLIEPTVVDAGAATIALNSVKLRIYYAVPVLWGGTIVNNIGPVRYRNEFNEAGAFWIRSASVVMEVQRREIND